jgi:hypothetical protein
MKNPLRMTGSVERVLSVMLIDNGGRPRRRYCPPGVPL